MKTSQILVAATLVLSSAVIAASHQSAVTASTESWTEGEVRKVDKDARKITLKHQAITSLDMPPMTMVFLAKDPSMLDKVKTGDAVRFKAEKIGGAFTVTSIEKAKP
jgi:Cu/Ag efflux protein CusF